MNLLCVLAVQKHLKRETDSCVVGR
jgi:hypothetical protein